MQMAQQQADARLRAEEEARLRALEAEEAARRQRVCHCCTNEMVMITNIQLADEEAARRAQWQADEEARRRAK